ncbi:MAG: hypothetical protein ACUVS7_14490 [Bryobacteraceae bacterium]
MNKRHLSAVGISCLLVLPVLLQRHVQAGDLASHTYNTWLVLLVKSGEPLGLEIVPQYSNVLFDWWLEALWRIGGPTFAEKAAVSVSVLLFFWGSFFLLERLTGRPAWPGAPLLAMLTYGWIYHQGFFNYYLSCAFGFWAIGFAASGGRRRWLAAPALLLAALAHLLGASVATAFTLYLFLWDRIQPRYRRWTLGAAVAALAGVAAAIAGSLPTTWHISRFLHLSGGTMFLIYGLKYAIPALMIVTYWPWGFLSGQRPARTMDVPNKAAHLAALVAAALVLLPNQLQWPGTRQALTCIDWRLALWFTLLLHGWLSTRLPQRYLLWVCSAAAVPYFLFLAADWRSLGKAEEAFHEAVHAVPAGSRVVTDVTKSPLGMNPLLHLIDRACIGHCFSYANYEPASAAFRLRSRPGSPVVLYSPERVSALMQGRYVVRPEDLPLYGLFLERLRPFTLEVRPLQAGEKVRRTQVPLPPEWF